VLWREQHPDAHEQTALNFSALGPPAQQSDFGIMIWPTLAV
jgi:hypothetical protein